MMDITQSAIWLSRVLRWLLAIFFVALAYQFDDAKILYFFAVVIFITGFLKPKRCIADACSNDVVHSHNSQHANHEIQFEELK